MKIYELANEFGSTPKDLISFLKERGFKASSHMQTATDEMIDAARADFKAVKTEEAKKEQPVKKTNQVVEMPKSKKVFKSDDLIPCHSVTPWALNAVGVNKDKVYHWEHFGDIDYVEYRDLQALRRSDIVMKPKIIIDDPDLRIQWARELGDNYKYFLDIEYPEEFFDLNDAEFEDLLKKAPDVVKEVIKATAVNMNRNKNYPSIQKLRIIDDVLGTCIKDFT